MASAPDRVTSAIGGTSALAALLPSLPLGRRHPGTGVGFGARRAGADQDHIGEFPQQREQQAVAGSAEAAGGPVGGRAPSSAVITLPRTHGRVEPSG